MSTQQKDGDYLLVNIKTQTGGVIPISVLIVPTIATPFTMKTGVTQLPYLRGTTYPSSYHR